MPRFAAFLRAVNVGGRVVKMQALKNALESMGLDEVESFIASGNLVFSSKGVKGPRREDRGGARKGVRLRGARLRADDRGGRSGRGARSVPEPGRRRAFRRTSSDSFRRISTPKASSVSPRLSTKDDLFHVRGRDFWWLSEHHQARPAITGRQLEKALGQPTTLRNVNTIRRMAEKFGEGRRGRFLRRLEGESLPPAAPRRRPALLTF